MPKDKAQVLRREKWEEWLVKESNHMMEWMLPFTEQLIKLEEKTPWMIDRHMTMMEKEQEYFIANDKKYFDKIINSTNLWRWIAFLAFIWINSLAFYMVNKWYSWEAVAMVISELVAAVIALFIWNKK